MKVEGQGNLHTMSPESKAVIDDTCTVHVTLTTGQEFEVYETGGGHLAVRLRRGAVPNSYDMTVRLQDSRTILLRGDV